MAFGITIDAKDGVFYVQGHVDEAAEFDSFLRAGAPLRVNLRGIQSINSLGLRRLIDCMRQLGEREVELYDCPPVFIEAVNVIPLVVGGQKRVTRIKSLYLPYHCQADHEAAHTIATTDVVVGDSISVPKPACAVCRAPMTPDLDSELDEFFFFLMA